MDSENLGRLIGDMIEEGVNERIDDVVDTVADHSTDLDRLERKLFAVEDLVIKGGGPTGQQGMIDLNYRLIKSLQADFKYYKQDLSALAHLRGRNEDLLRSIDEGQRSAADRLDRIEKDAE